MKTLSLPIHADDVHCSDDKDSCKYLHESLMSGHSWCDLFHPPESDGEMLELYFASNNEEDLRFKRCKECLNAGQKEYPPIPITGGGIITRSPDNDYGILFDDDGITEIVLPWKLAQSDIVEVYRHFVPFEELETALKRIEELEATSSKMSLGQAAEEEEIVPPTCLGEEMKQVGISSYSLHPACIPWAACDVILFPNGWGWRIIIVGDFPRNIPAECHHENRRTTAQEAADSVNDWFRELAAKLMVATT